MTSGGGGRGSSTLYEFVKDTLERSLLLIFGFIFCTLQSLGLLKSSTSSKHTIYGCFLIMKVALSIMLICWQQHATLTPESPTITFDMDEALYKDHMPLASAKAQKNGKSAEMVK
ncbi:hypothetical protein Y032_0176g545 [Ancylostoma ceylanicum]|uniref:Uncharacterized protein n=1 Tax=Ancylostoma ceylanicum TaxID=53326 RepID=A0A016STP3_9BILA|nr:hypothetical protein Y032_0176g545 [Ancylostoma ceylanicum]